MDERLPPCGTGAIGPQSPYRQVLYETAGVLAESPAGDPPSIDAACADLEKALSGLTEELRDLIQES
jgi:hypothetical protein